MLGISFSCASPPLRLPGLRLLRTAAAKAIALSLLAPLHSYELPNDYNNLMLQVRTWTGRRGAVPVG